MTVNYTAGLQFRFGRTQTQQFLDRDFVCAPGRVLPIAPLSEHYMALAVFIRDLRLTDYTSVLDLGSGTGVLGISLYRPGVALTMTDVDPNACALTKLNAQNIDCTVVQSSWFDSVQGQWDLIIANPPHGLSSEWHEYPQAQSVVPRISVDGGADGCDHLRSILARAHPFMLGRLALIHHRNQADLVQSEAQQHHLRVFTQRQVNSVQMTVLTRH